MSEFDRRSRVPIEDLAEPILAWRGWGVGIDMALEDIHARIEDIRSGRSTEPMLEFPRRLLSTSTLGGVRPWPTSREGGLVAECRCNWRFRRHRKTPGKPPGRLAWLCHGPRVANSGYGCGVYGVKSYRQFIASPWGNATIVGCVLLGGRVWEHQGGYRAEKATVAGLVNLGYTGAQANLEGKDEATIQYLAGRYGVPVLSVAEAENYGRDRQASAGGTPPGAGTLDAPGAGEGAEPEDPGEGAGGS